MGSSDDTDFKWGKDFKTPDHQPWGFREEAFIFDGKRPYFPNLRPYAFQLLSWLKREGHVEYIFESDAKYRDAPTNPYSYEASSLAMLYSSIVNEACEFGKNPDSKDRLDSEMKFLRFRSELVLYSARLCEVLTKQLLFCTNFENKDYERLAIGALLSRRCQACQKVGKKHFFSYLGSLAHGYGLCHTFDNCLHDRMTILNTDRNSTAAHSGTWLLRNRNVRKSREEMLAELDRIGLELIHILSHIVDVESRMLADLKFIIRTENSALLEVRIPIVSTE